MVAPKSVEEMRDQNLFLNNGEATPLLTYLRPCYAMAMQFPGLVRRIQSVERCPGSNCAIQQSAACRGPRSRDN